jgi:hypothetical protein
MCADEFAHQADAFRIVENHDADPMLPEKVLGSHEVSIFSNHYARNAEQQRCTRAHNARAESAEQRQLSPIASPARFAEADCFRVSGRIAALNSQVMSSGYDLTLRVGQHRTDRQASFAQPFPSFFESFLQ